MRTGLPLGIGLALYAGAVACAAERPVTRPPFALIEGLADCGGGGFSLPGSGGCIRLQGAVTATTVLRAGTASSAPHRNAVSTFAVGRVSADVRVPTEMGPFRAYTSLRLPVGEEAGGRR